MLPSCRAALARPRRLLPSQHHPRYVTATATRSSVDGLDYSYSTLPARAVSSSRAVLQNAAVSATTTTTTTRQTRTPAKMSTVQSPSQPTASQAPTPAAPLLRVTRHDVYDFINPQTTLRGSAAGKAVLITGAGTGIGRGIARAFALAGASQLYLAARRAAPLEETAALIRELAPACTVHVFPGVDIGSRDSVLELFGHFGTESSSSSLPIPHVVVSNAGVAGANAPIADADPLKWAADVQTNLLGTFFVAHAYLQQLRSASSSTPASSPASSSPTPGYLINVSSNSSWRYVTGMSAYAASKVAVNTLSEYLERDTAASLLRCFALHPGGVLVDSQLSGTVQIPPHVAKMMIDQPALPGATAVYLASGRADWLAGRYVLATWDMQELAGLRVKVEGEDLLRTRVKGVEPEVPVPVPVPGASSE